MDINISEDTKIRSGKITIEGRKRNYTAFSRFRATGYEVSVIITNSFGSIVDAFSRSISHAEVTYQGEAITAAINEWKDDQKEAA